MADKAFRAGKLDTTYLSSSPIRRKDDPVSGIPDQQLLKRPGMFNAFCVLGRGLQMFLAK